MKMTAQHKSTTTPVKVDMTWWLDLSRHVYENRRMYEKPAQISLMQFFLSFKKMAYIQQIAPFLLHIFSTYATGIGDTVDPLSNTIFSLHGCLVGC